MSFARVPSGVGRSHEICQSEPPKVTSVSISQVLLLSFVLFLLGRKSKDDEIQQIPGSLKRCSRVWLQTP